MDLGHQPSDHPTGASPGALPPVLTPEGAVGDLLHVFTEQLLGCMSEDMCQVPVGAGSVMAPHGLRLTVPKPHKQKKDNSFRVLEGTQLPSTGPVETPALFCHRGTCVPGAHGHQGTRTGGLCRAPCPPHPVSSWSCAMAMSQWWLGCRCPDPAQRPLTECPLRHPSRRGHFAPLSAQSRL